VSVLQILFFAWCAIAVVWLIARIVNGMRSAASSSSQSVEFDVAAQATALDAAKAPTPVAAQAIPIDTTTTYDPSPAQVVPLPQLSIPTEAVPLLNLSPPPLPDSVAPIAPEPIKTPTRARPITPHTDVPPIPVAPLAEMPMRGLSDILGGMQMPCELAPLMSHTGESMTSLRRATFATTTFRPPDVGMALANELERLNMTIQSVSDNQAVATRDADSVMLTIHRTAELFPTAPEMSVVVEIEVV
jgi:hypothetical protein